MGLDTVEMVMAIEEEFGIDIPDDVAEGLTTVGSTYEYLKKQLKSEPPAYCLSQRIFHKLRRALMENYGLGRAQITMDMRLSDVMTMKQVADGWPFLTMFADLRFPSFETANEFLLFKLTRETLTVRELVDALAVMNKGRFLEAADSDEMVWKRLVDVIVRQLNVSRSEVTYDSWYTKDLGAD